jgi:hypothetical protein
MKALVSSPTATSIETRVAQQSLDAGDPRLRAKLLTSGIPFPHGTKSFLLVKGKPLRWLMVTQQTDPGTS